MGGTRGKDLAPRMPLPMSGPRQGPAVPRGFEGNLQYRADPLTPLLLPPHLSLQEPGGQIAPKKAPGECKASPTPEQTRRLAQAMMTFTTDLFSLVAQSSTRPNLILSPLSVALALSHVALGTGAADQESWEASRNSPPSPELTSRRFLHQGLLKVC